MSVRRENTFRIDYANVPKKPSFEELHDFVATELNLKYEQVIRLQPSRALGCAFVKVVDLELAHKIVAEHDNKHETEVDGKAYKIRITLEDGAVEVKLTDLSEDISHEQIVEFLSDYGEVLSIADQVWDSKFRFAGRPTGARIVRMVLKRNIESYITIEGQTTNVTYFGQLQTCRHCSEFVHNGISCVQNKKLLVQKTLSYANVTKQPGLKSKAPKPTVTKQTTTLLKPCEPTSDEAGETRKSPQTQQQNTGQDVLAAPKLSTKNTVAPKLSTINPSAPKLVKSSLSEQGDSLMAPPAPIASCSRIATRQKNDGNETDSSSTSGSNRSRTRAGPPGKKQRQNPDDDAREEISA